MKEIKENRKIRYTKMVLQDSLFELMEKKSITKITIKELCENADINRTTFYAHYKDQYDLLYSIENEVLSWIKESLSNLICKSDKNERRKALEKIFQYVVDNSRHLQILMSEQGDIDFQKKIFILIYQECGILPTTEKGMDLGVGEDYFIFAVNGSVGLLQHWLKNGINRSARKMAEIVDDMTEKSTFMNMI